VQGQHRAGVPLRRRVWPPSEREEAVPGGFLAQGSAELRQNSSWHPLVLHRVGHTGSSAVEDSFGRAATTRDKKNLPYKDVIHASCLEIVKEFIAQFWGYSRLASLFAARSWAVSSASGSSVLHLNTLYTLFDTVTQGVKSATNIPRVPRSQFLRKSPLIFSVSVFRRVLLRILEPVEPSRQATVSTGLSPFLCGKCLRVLLDVYFKIPYSY